MEAPFYLIVGRNGSTRTTKKQPDLRWDEISIKMNLEIPEAIFERPILTADIKVEDSDIAPREISPDIKNNIEEAIQEHIGIEVKLNIVNDNPTKP